MFISSYSAQYVGRAFTTQRVDSISMFHTQSFMAAMEPIFSDFYAMAILSLPRQFHPYTTTILYKFTTSMNRSDSDRLNFASGKKNAKFY